jgi:hypothetical protein
VNSGSITCGAKGLPVTQDTSPKGDWPNAISQQNAQNATGKQQKKNRTKLVGRKHKRTTSIRLRFERLARRNCSNASPHWARLQETPISLVNWQKCNTSFFRIS